MQNPEKTRLAESVAATFTTAKEADESVRLGGVFRIECRDKDGNVRWEAEAHNLVVNVGLKDMNDRYFAGSGYTALWYLGLYGAGASNNPAASDTAASHAGWTEVTTYSNATRPLATFGVSTTANPSVISNSASPAVFNINGTATVGGAFLISNNVKGGTTGILFSAADFQAPGDRSVLNGDTLSLTYTFSGTAT
jgi:hypothetical protein